MSHAPLPEYQVTLRAAMAVYLNGGSIRILTEIRQIKIQVETFTHSNRSKQCV